MGKRTDPSDLDAPALAHHLEYRNLRPRSRRPSSPDLSRRHAFECRVHAILSGEQPDEAEAIDLAREAEEARADALMSEEERLGLCAIGGGR